MKPYLTLEWNDTKTEAKGWLCIHNLVKGAAGGGIRMHPTVTRQEVERLALGMAYKYKAIESETTGGCKGGIVYDSHMPDAYDVLKRYITAMRPYVDLGLGIGSDLGTSYDDVLNIFAELGMGYPQTLSQAAMPEFRKGQQAVLDFQNQRVDGFLVNDVVTGYGVAFAADEAWAFINDTSARKGSVIIQGFGCVGASCAAKMADMGYRVVGIADAKQFVYRKDGLDVKKLISSKDKYGVMDLDRIEHQYEVMDNSKWLEYPCDILIPAALEDVINETTGHRVKAGLVVEGANIPTNAAGDKILIERKVDVVPDFIANMGAIRFFDQVGFSLIDFTTDAVIGDIDRIARKNVRMIFTENRRTGEYQRDIAKRLFAPTVQDEPDFDGKYR
ncbi:MAG TPA: Glu/Leu/Phe/Val dehydrogenase dimerization domain-containing protein [Bacillota bacterium]|nr:Glu/Leu/Phe/Val dehydrogenase dimerization domain-containing protein [Bacillota bacterium]